MSAYLSVSCCANTLLDIISPKSFSSKGYIPFCMISDDSRIDEATNVQFLSTKLRHYSIEELIGICSVSKSQILNQSRSKQLTVYGLGSLGINSYGKYRSYLIRYMPKLPKHRYRASSSRRLYVAPQQFQNRRQHKNKPSRISRIQSTCQKSLGGNKSSSNHSFHLFLDS